MSDLSTLFRIGVSPVEIIVRGTVMYWFLFVLFRFWLRRGSGSIGIADVLLLVLIADAAQNAMAGGYDNITDGCILVATLAGWDWLTDWTSFHSPLLRKFLEPPSLPLVRNGQINRRNMRRELVTEDELMANLRQNGIAHLCDVRLARLEGDGEISVIPYPTTTPAQTNRP